MDVLYLVVTYIPGSPTRNLPASFDTESASPGLRILLPTLLKKCGDDNALPFWFQQYWKFGTQRRDGLTAIAKGTSFGELHPKIYSATVLFLVRAYRLSGSSEFSKLAARTKFMEVFSIAFDPRPVLRFRSGVQEELVTKPSAVKKKKSP
ncbi:hypothetical protein BJX63DRAFT_334451 [Aspergillus granulosus]|uniref:Uncharacterized protein n=1 Tax=Aspergillus granulosus TaxID=176169 RepID=A0ABR4HX81_9EURO